jgi:hypothetical protein
MRTVRDIALEIAVYKVITDEGMRRLQAAKAEAHDAFRDTGTTQAQPELPDGTRVATASLAGGGKAASVTNEAAFLAWMQEHHPDEIVVTVRESAKKRILDGSKAAGRPIDDVTGEIPAGVSVGYSTPYVSLRFKPGGQHAIIAAWRAGKLTGIDLVAPEAIESGDAA